MPLIFERDPGKDRANRKKHCVSFSEARTIFGDRTELMISDPEHSDDEERLDQRWYFGQKAIIACCLYRAW